MRNNTSMLTYIVIAETTSQIMRESDLTLEEQYEMVETIRDCLKKAAKAGGFLSTRDFVRWMDRQNT
jgi:hypothetical protein